MASRFTVLLVADIGALILAGSSLRGLLGAIAWERWLPFDPMVAGPLAPPGQPGSSIFLPSVLLALLVTGAYSRHRALNMTARLGFAAAAAAAVTAIPLAAVLGVRIALVEAGAVAIGSWLVLIAARALAETFLRHVWPVRRGAAAAVLVGPPESVNGRIARAIESPGGDYRIVERYMVSPGSLRKSAPSIADDVAAIVEHENAEAVVLCDVLPESFVAALLDTVGSAGCQLLYPAGAIHIQQVRPRLVWHHDQPFLELGLPVLKASAVATKRICDLAGASALLVLAAPLMLLIALGIKLDSPGPVFFWHDRPGLGGRRFRMLKFRTMRIGADEERAALAEVVGERQKRLFKIPADPRATRFGRLLRRWSLDELPQLWNVLHGEMSLVGPRPFVESGIEAYGGPDFRRHDTTPGITGLWQVSGRCQVLNFEDVVFLDRQYIEQWSVWLDLSILFRTIPAVMRRTGAY